ncbi:MAG: ATP-binding protein [Methanosarcinaceae archaeon]|nr:ATP-binding protein [Methanosarcinaceae archaeon]MDF1532955.1 ATP-binding protein [Methanosarcinaceae archaeon]
MLEKNQIFEILRDQNYWFKDFTHEEYIERKHYLGKMKDLLESKSITAVTGPRRAGKTVLLKQTINEMMEEGVKKEQILYLNLEDYRLYSNHSIELLSAVLETYKDNINPKNKIYFFIDEIQNIEGFEHFLRTEYDRDGKSKIKLIITGSNSKLLSKELGTLLTGRTSTLTVYPFSFEEYLEYNNVKLDMSSYFTLENHKNEIKQLFNKYVAFGSIPEFLDETQPYDRLNEYLENIIFKDIVVRFNIRNTRLVKELAIFLATNTSKTYSINQLSKMFKCSVNTIKEYLFDLEQAYLFFNLKQYSYSYKEQVTTQSKSYCIDTGLASATGFQFLKNNGRLIENAVFIELKRRGHDIYYHKGTGTGVECDFLIKEGMHVTSVIQVTESLTNPDTKKREIKGLLDATQQYGLEVGLILTDNEYDDIVQDDVTINVRPIWFWMLGI